MTGALYPVELATRVGVDLVKAVARRRILMSCIGLALIMVIAGAYIAIDGVRVNPARKTISVRVLLDESGGLLVNQDVTVRGIPVGRITAVNLADHGVEAVAQINSRSRIPADSPVRVSGLSAAGEQYLDFRPERSGGPYLTDGAVISESQTTIPMSLAHIIDDSRGALAQLDPAKVNALLGELRVSREGPQKLASIFDGSIFLSSTLAGVLPQTVSMLRNTQVLFTTLADVNAGLHRTAVDLQNVLGGVNKMDGGFRTLVDNGSGQLANVDNLLADNRENIVALLGNLTTVSQLLYMRIPALQNLWRPDHESLIDHISTIIHDNALWGVGSAYLRYACDYDVPRKPPSQVDSPEPYLYTYCNNPDPSVLVRGARNAPRPPGDDTAGPPAAYDPLATTDSTPFYPPYTLPTPYGGPQLRRGCRIKSNRRNFVPKPDHDSDVFDRLAEDAEPDTAPPDSESITETEADDAAVEPDTAHPAGALRRRLVLGLVGAVAVAAVGLSAFLGWRLNQLNETAEAGNAALEAAKAYAVTLTTLNANDIDKNYQAALDGATGQFKEDYSQGSSHLRQILIDNKAAGKGVVIDAAVKSATKNSVEVLLFVDQSISNAVLPQPRIDRNRVQMTMELVDGRWLASKVDII